MLAGIFKLILATIVLDLCSGPYPILPLWQGLLLVVLCSACLAVLTHLFNRDRRTARFTGLLAYFGPLAMAVVFCSQYSIPQQLTELAGYSYRSWGLPALFDPALFILLWLPAEAAATLRSPVVRMPFAMLLRLTAVPAVLLVAEAVVVEVICRLPFPSLFWLAENPILSMAFVAIASLIAVCTFPAILVMLLGARKGTVDSSTERLHEFARQKGVWVRKVLVWPTSGVPFHNALATGIVRPFKYVLITESLLGDFHPDLVKAVFSHELAHLKMNHFPRLIVALAGITGSGMAIALLAPGDGYAALLAPVLSLAVMAGLFFYSFLPYYRSIERQADIEGAALLGDPGMMADALEYLTRFVPVKLKKRSVTHYGLDARVELLRSLAREPGALENARKAQRKVISLRVAVYALLALCSAAAITSRSDLLRAENYAMLSSTALERGAIEESLRSLEAGSDGEPGNHTGLFMGLHHVDLGNARGAGEVLVDFSPDASGMYGIIMWHFEAMVRQRLGSDHPGDPGLPLLLDEFMAGVWREGDAMHRAYLLSLLDMLLAQPAADGV